MGRAIAVWVTGLLALVMATAALASGAPVPADVAFRLGVERTADGGVELIWQVRPGHYLYRDRIQVTDATGAPVPLALPAGIVHDDPNFGPTEILPTDIHARLEEKGAPGPLKVSFQGCAEAGICYPPVTRLLDPVTLALEKPVRGGLSPAATWSLPATSGPASTPAPGSSPFVLPETRTMAAEAAPASSSGGAHAAVPAFDMTASDVGDADDVAVESRLLASGDLMWTLAAFFGFGLLLALTPCVFPMIPILSGLIVRSGAGRGRGFVLSLAYVLAMAVAYGLLGVVAAWTGGNLQLALQTPAALGVMAAVFVVLALSSFGLFELQLPAALSARIDRATAGRGGSLSGAALMGFGSALVVGPCVTPPLAAALLHVAEGGDVVRGAGALFALGLGMGAPLLLIGVFGPALLPRAGRWLVPMRQLFGLVFLGVAIALIARVIPETAALVLWGVFALGAGLAVTAYDVALGRPRFSAALLPRVAGGAAVAGGVVALLLALPGPGAALRTAVLGDSELPAAGIIHTVTTDPEFEAALLTAQAAGRPVVVDFTAAWCTTCKDFERSVLTDDAIRARMADVTLVRADMTDYDAAAQALMKRFQVVGPPTLFLVDPVTATEIDGSRQVGPVTVESFARLLSKAGA
ncbi:protein-disulfide reductase DsbD [Segnochrobactraceae bacterium EtOH-i3]